MWRTCAKPDCDKRFFQGGLARASDCPECKAERKKKQHAHWDALRKEKGQKVVEHRKWDLRGNLVESHLYLEPKVCEFCEEEYMPRKKTDRYCDSCKAQGLRWIDDRGRNDAKKSIGLVKAVACEACGEKFWQLRTSKQTWCSDVCKEMLRERHDCLYCGEPIEATQPITAKFCKGPRCGEAYRVIQNHRDDRDGKFKGQLHTPTTRFNKIRMMIPTPSQEILDEFNPDKEEDG